MLKSSLNKTLNAKNLSGRKQCCGDGILLNLDSVAEAKKNRMEEKLALILKSADYNPQELLKYIENHGTGVYYISSSKQLIAVAEKEGFIYPQKGHKALYLSLLTEKKIRFKTEEMFILTKGEINKYCFIYYFYNWYAFKHGISGLDADSIELLNKYLFNSSEEEINKLQLSGIYRLKDAIKQDKSAIEFVLKLCRNCEGSKNAFEKLRDKGANL